MMWALVWWIACSQPVEPELGPFCEDSLWAWHETVVRDPCWGDEGEAWSEPRSELACLGENRFAWRVGDIAFDCDLQNAAFSCTGPESRLRGRMVDGELATGVWTYWDGECAVDTQFEAERLR